MENRSVKMAKKNNNFQDEGAPFNMALLFYVSLRKLIDQKNLAKINGQIEGWFHGLLAIRDEIDFVITKGIYCNKCKKKIKNSDKNWIDSKFREVENLIGNNELYDGALRRQASAIVSSEAPPVLRDIDRKLMLIMNSNHMIFPNIEAKGGLDELRKKYGL